MVNDDDDNLQRKARGVFPILEREGQSHFPPTGNRPLNSAWGFAVSSPADPQSTSNLLFLAYNLTSSGSNVNGMVFNLLKNTS